MIKSIKLAKDYSGGHILNALLHGKQKKAGKYVFPHETDAPILVRAKARKEESLEADRDRAETDFGLSCEDMFCAIDANGDGILTRETLKSFLAQANINMSDEEFEHEVYDRCLDGRREEKLRGKFVFGDFVDLIREYEMRLFFDAADADHDGFISFEDLHSACEARNMRMSVAEMAAIIIFFDINSDNKIGTDDIKSVLKKWSISSEAIPEYVRKVMVKLGDEISKSGRGMVEHRESFRRAAKEIEKANGTKWTGTRRWRPFIHFERVVQGQRAMHGGEKLILDVLPGRHSVGAIVDFGDLPSLKPYYLEVAGVKWQRSSSAGGSGRVFFPWSFSGALPLEIATGELLSYYGCRIANSCAGDILLGRVP